MSNIYIPSNGPEKWRTFLAEPEKQWRKGFSARTLAHCWEENTYFPLDVKKVLSQAEPFKDIDLLFGIPEYQVSLPGGIRASQNDLWVLASCGNGLISIAVEGKVNEPFGETIKEWNYSKSPGKEKRLQFLCSLLNIDFPPPEDLRYQLFHRCVSSIIMAKKYHAQYAIMLVHSFSQTDHWHEDYEKFINALGTDGGVNEISFIGERSGIILYTAWVRGDSLYLEK